jgi:hypothetical protein
MSDPTLKKASDAAMTTDASSSTVKFNVGGRLYEVPRALVEKFPSTMLARMVSDTWQKDPEATLFIGRSGERFEYSLDYMRADKVWLPHNMPKEAFLDDLDFYGFENVDPSKICGGSSYLKEEYVQFMASNKIARHCEEVAYECFVRVSQGKSLEDMLFSKSNGSELSEFFKSNVSELYNSVLLAVDKKAEFQDHLAKYGLVLVTAVHGNNGGYILTLKEKEQDTSNNIN